ncbi:MAG: FtsQ-type POTRA domain-containing protein [Deltaproteobacteria bacterium]|nr:FtsQ-type POTRA domain-containing protein [Deltaproteobacteria bacterium]MDZ4225100.1 FtsQ-type POTRA domain-containing protein [bacterium]
MGFILENQNIVKRPKHRLSRLFKGTGPILKGCLGAALLFGAGILSWFAITQTNHFALARVEVKGDLKHLSKEQILGAARVSLGENLFSISLEKVEQNILSLPWVASVSVRRQAPSILSIQVKEQRPVALLLKGGLHFVSADGIVFKEVEKELEKDLPVLTGFDKKDSLQSAVRLIHFLENSSDFELFGVSEIYYNDATGFSVVTLSGPTEVKLGKEGFEEKVNRLKNIWPQVKERFGRVKGMDLDYADKAFVKL